MQLKRAVLAQQEEHGPRKAGNGVRGSEAAPLVLVRIVAPHFVAGLEHDNDRVRRVAPIIKYMLGWTPRKVWDYCQSKGWKYKTLV